MFYWILGAAALLYVAGVIYGRAWRTLAGRGYPSPDEAQAAIEQLARSRPDLCAIEEIGRSTEGRPIQALKLGGAGAMTGGGDRPRLLVTANIHAVEYIGSYVARALATRLVAGYGSASHITDLLDRADVWFVPLLNPDGAARVWRRRGWSGLGWARFTATGVDPNRNFPFVPIAGRTGWNTARDKPGSPYYRGPHPLSEPECLALAQLCERQRFCGAINFHSFGAVVYMPAVPDADGGTASDAGAVRGLSVFHDVFQAHQKHLRYRPIPERSAAIVGQLDAFLLNAFGTVSVTVEVSRPGLHVLLPWNLFNFFWWANPPQPQRWADNDVEASTHALAALVERTGGTPGVAAQPELRRVQGAGVGVQGSEEARGLKLSRPSQRRFAAVLSVLLLATAVGCSNSNYVLEACPMKPNANGVQRDAHPATDLRVMTLNMWGIRFVAADIDARFDALAERLNGDSSIDVVGLQEVWADAPRRRLLKSVAQAFPHQVDFQGEHGRSGLAILSRHPFAGAPRFIPYPKAGKWWKPWTGEWLGGKGIGAVEIRSAAGPVWFFVTHLHACYAAGAPTSCDDGDEYGSYRGHQLETLRATVNEIAGERPALIAGDFNFTAQSKYYKAMISHGVGVDGAYDPAWQRVEEPEAPATRIDYLWIRPGKNDSWNTLEAAQTLFTEPVRSSNGAGVPLSDHCAVAATLQQKK